MPGDWSEREVRVLVDDYFEMLRSELRAEDYSKADHRTEILRALPGRTKGAVEFKHQNVSAILEEMALPWIEGYKPMHNYQELLKKEVQRKIAELTAR